MATIHIFLDTNIFLHFNAFDNIPWDSIVNEKDYKLVILPTVISELDAKKYDKNDKIQKQSRKILPKIFKHIEESKYPELILLTTTPSNKDYERFALNSIQQDEQILCSILNYIEDNPQQDVVFISYDYAPIMKAGSHKIKSIKMDEKYLLKQKTDLEEKNFKLEEENKKLKKQFPVVELSFANGERIFDLKFEYEKKSINKDEFIKEIKKKYPVKEFKNDYGLKGLLDGTKILTGFQKNGIDNYNSDRIDFFKKLPDALDKYNEYQEFMAKTVEFDVVIKNTGTAPANDVDVYMHFPNGFKLYNEDDFPEEPGFPSTPKLRGLADIIQMPTFSNINISSIDRSFRSNISPTEIEETNSYNLNKHIGKLKHNESISFGPLFLAYDTIEKAKSFEVEYLINVDNIPEQVSGKLVFKVN